jgi:hypothetical protein
MRAQCLDWRFKFMEEIWKKLEISRLVGPPYDGRLLLTKNAVPKRSHKKRFS